jgi:polyferredoxin
MPSWKHRRRLIYAALIFSFGMITFGAVTWQSDTGVAQQLIIGGVALVSIILTAYVSFATYEDVKLWKEDDDVHE